VELTFNHIATFTQSNASVSINTSDMHTYLPNINYSALHLLDQYCMLADNLLMVEINIYHTLDKVLLDFCPPGYTSAAHSLHKDVFFVLN